MTYMRSTLLLIPAVLILFISCNSNNNNKKNTTEPMKDSVVAKKDTKVVSRTEASKAKPPIINIVDTVAPKRIVVYMKDSATTYQRISIKLGQIYGAKLTDCFRKNALKVTGAPMAWYQTQKAPFFFEAGMPVNKKPAKLTPGVKIKELNADSVVIAHFYGPYDLLHVGYDALKEWMQDHHRTATGAPYEIYIGDPIDKKGKAVDPYKVQTDIVFPRR